MNYMPLDTIVSEQTGMYKDKLRNDYLKKADEFDKKMNLNPDKPIK